MNDNARVFVRKNASTDASLVTRSCNKECAMGIDTLFQDPACIQFCFFMNETLKSPATSFSELTAFCCPTGVPFLEATQQHLSVYLGLPG